MTAPAIPQPTPEPVALFGPSDFCRHCGGTGCDRFYDHERRTWVSQSCYHCHGTGHRGMTTWVAK